MGAASITTVIKEQHQNYIEKSTMSDWITAESKADKKAKAQTANPKSTSKPRAQGPAKGHRKGRLQQPSQGPLETAAKAGRLRHHGERQAPNQTGRAERGSCRRRLRRSGHDPVL